MVEIYKDYYAMGLMTRQDVLDAVGVFLTEEEAKEVLGETE